jgi:hypothetical protein
METKFSKSSDKEHVIKLESSILHAIWVSNVAYAGGEVGVEVKTMFVGEGAKINVAGKSQKGKSLGKISDKIYGNGFSGRLKIPEKIKPGDEAYFIVKLPQLGLKAESNRIPIRPGIKVSNMKWDKKEARRGDTLKLTAEIENVRDESEVKVLIYERSQEGNHDKIVEMPGRVKNQKLEILWEYEYHESTENIPTEDELQKYNKEKHYNHPEYFFVIKIDDVEYGKNQESGLLRFKDWVEISLTDEKGEPADSEKYKLHMSDGSKREGTLDSEGRAIEEDLPPGAIRVEFPDSENAS